MHYNQKKEVTSFTITKFMCPYCELDFEEKYWAEACRDDCHEEAENLEQLEKQLKDRAVVDMRSRIFNITKKGIKNEL